MLIRRVVIINYYFFNLANNTTIAKHRAASIMSFPIASPFIQLLIDVIVYIYIIISPHNFLDINLRETLQSHGGGIELLGVVPPYFPAPWCSGLTYWPVKPEIAGSNPVGVARCY